MNKQQLANKIWASANKMRSKIDANEYKDYILGLVFYKFLSDNEVNYILKDMKNASDEEKQQALMSLVENYDDENSKIIIDYCKNNIGYFIEYKNLFSTWLLPESNFTVSDLSVALNSFDRLVSQNYKPVYDGIFKTLQAGLSKLGENPASQTRALKDLVKLIKDIPTDGSQDYDVLGYVYEYLISNFAANAGKKAGEFYTPHEVAILMSEIVAEHHKDKRQIEIYDPTSGSGSLLITIGKSVGRHISDKNRVKYYAQELKENTYNLTRMNLVMRGIQPSNINTRCADSLDEDWPVYKAGNEIGQPLYVDAVVSNPPYSQEWDPTDKENDPRFKDYGLAPKNKADYAFLLHELHHLKPDGILTIVLPHGVLFRNEEEHIRKNLIEKNNIDAIIGLPSNIFFGASLPTIIMVLKQHKDSDDIVIIDASKGFVKCGKNNKLRACDIKKISDTIKDRKSIKGYSKVVSREEIRQNDYNLIIPRYVNSSEGEEPYDIYATMYGGIPNEEINQLNRFWNALPSLKNELFKNENDSPYSSLKSEDIRGTINNNSDVIAFKAKLYSAFNGFEELLHDKLIDNVMSVRELQVQDEIATEIFQRLETIPLVDKYAAYQALADNWQSIVGDVETIQQEGFDSTKVVETAYKVVKKNDEEIEVPDGLKGRIFPFELVQKVKFQVELDAILSFQTRSELINAQLDDIREEFTEEEKEEYCDGEKDYVFDKKRIISDSKVKSNVGPETKSKLKRIISLWDELSENNKKIKQAKQSLLEKTITCIKNLTNSDICELLHLKWISPIVEGINSTLLSSLLSLENNVTFISEKYPLSYLLLNKELRKAQEELTDLVAKLEGDHYSIIGLNAFTDGFAFIKQMKSACIQMMFPKEGKTVPSIRFSGFSGEWTKCKLSDFASRITRKNSKLESTMPLTISSIDGLVSQTDYFNSIVAGANLSNYYLLKRGEFAYNKSYSKGYPFGSVKRLDRYEQGVLSTLYIVFEVNPDKISSDFLTHFFDSTLWHQEVAQRAAEGARNHGLLNIGADDFMDISILVPKDRTEQDLIGSFFTLLNKVDSLQSQGLEALKQVSKSLLKNG